MKHPATKVLIALALIVSLMNATSVAFAETTFEQDEEAEEVSAEAMVADLFFLRPLGALATVVGAAVWVLALPFTLPTKNGKKVGQKLVVEPAKYTFSRPLGQT